jgi:asparagine synthase (glutamine-hydrolysing)
MRSRLRHRGPDDEGTHVAGPIGLGVTRLAIIDVDGGHQPVSNEDGTVWAVQNGEIYNYLDLRRELIERGHVFSSHSDTEVLVHLYEEFGADLVEHLRGMFAIAVWDATGRRLLLARDRLGIKPLFYAEHDGALLFSSEIPSLLEAGLVRSIDPIALHDYLTHDFVPGPRTMFASIRRLQAGHRMVCEDSPVVDQYWDLPRQDENAYASTPDASLPGMLLERLEVAVRSHLVSDVPVGAFLSGGLDSSIVVALMSRATDERVATFSVGFEEETYNELPYARRVAAMYGTDHHELVVEPHIQDVIHELVESFGEPFADSSAVATYYVSQQAARHTKVVLSGDGGDEVFGGYVTYQADRLARWYRRLPELLGGRAIPAVAGLLPASEGKMSFDLRARRFTENASRDPVAAHGSWRAIFSEDMKADLYSAAYRRGLGESLPAEYRSLDVFRTLFEAYPGDDLLNRLMYLDTKINLVDDMLTKVDRTSMAHSLEVRVPLLDHALVEWMAVVPSRLKVRRLTLKHLLKQASRQLLPDDIVNRPKAGFHVPVPSWLKRELRPMVDDVLSAESITRQGVFDPAVVGRLVDEHYAGRANHSRNLWGLLMFGLWYDRYMRR